MSLLETQKISDAGLAPVLVPASALGDTLSNGKGVMFYAKNTSGSVRNITTVVQNTDTSVEGFGNLTKNSNVTILQGGEGALIGPIPYAFEDIKSQVLFTYDNEDGLSVAVVLLPTPPVIVPQIIVSGDAICTTLTLSELVPFTTNATAVYLSNNVVVTNTAGGVNALLSLDTINTFDLTGSVPLAFEATCLAPSVLDDNGAHGVGAISTDFSAIGGLQRNFGTGADGTIGPIGGGAPVVSGLPRPTFPYTFHVEINTDGSGTFEDSDGNSGSFTAQAGSFTGKTGQMLVLSSAPDTASSTVNATSNASGPLIIALTDPTAKTYCNLTGAPVTVAEYKFFEQSKDANVLLSNADRTITMTHDNVLQGDFIYTFAFDSDIQTRGTYNGNVFELEIDTHTSEAITSFLFLEVGVAPQSPQGLSIAKDADSNAIRLDGWELFTHTIASGDIFAALVLSDTSGAFVETRWCFKPAGGDAVFITGIPLRDSDNTNSTNIVVENASSGVQAAGVLAMTFDGIDGDLGITNYPAATAKAYNGDPIPLSTAAESRNILWNINVFNATHELVGDTIAVTFGNTLTIATGASSATKRMRAWKNVMAEDGTGIFATGISITTPFTTGAGEICGAIGMGSDSTTFGGNSRIWIAQTGTDLELVIISRDNTRVDTTIKSTYSSAIGDEWMIEIDTNNHLARAHVDDGVLLTTTAWVNYDIGAQPVETRWMEVAGCDDSISTVPDSNGCVLDNIMHTGISAGMLSALAVGCKNFNNVTL